MIKTRILTSALLCSVSLIAVPGSAEAATLLFSSGTTSSGERLAALTDGPVSVRGGLTQIRTDNGGLISFVGDADFTILGDGEVSVGSGRFTATAGRNGAPLTIRSSQNGAVTISGANSAASLSVSPGGSVAGRSLGGGVSVSSGGRSQSFAMGRSFQAAAGAAPSSTVTAGVQPTSAPASAAVLTSASQSLGGNMIGALNRGVAGINLQQNPILTQFPQGSVADLLAYAYSRAGVAGTPTFNTVSDAYLQVYLAFLRSGGIPGGFTDANAAGALSDYLAYLRSGGVPAQYTGAAASLIQAYLSYLQATGLPSGLTQAQRDLIESYFDLLEASGGQPVQFDAAAVASALSGYLQYLAAGGAPGSYSGAPQSLIAAYLAYISQLGLPDTVDASVRAQIAAYQALLAAGGTNLSGAGAADALSAYLAYLQAGGTAGDYTAYSAAVLQAYLNYLRAIGLPSTLDPQTRALLLAYFDYLDAGGQFGTFPIEEPEEPEKPEEPGEPGEPGVITPPDYTYTGGFNPAKVNGLLSYGRPDSKGNYGTWLGGGNSGTIDGEGGLLTLGSNNGKGSAQVHDVGGDATVLIGRWSNGTANLGNQSTVLGPNQSAHYMLIAPPPANFPASGRIDYEMIAATQPTFLDGRTLPGLFVADFSVAFGSRPTYGMEGKITMPEPGGNVVYSFATQGGVANPNEILAGTNPLSSGMLLSMTGNGLACSGSCPIAFNGSFSGANLSHAGFVYTAGKSNSEIGGAVAFRIEGFGGTQPQEPGGDPGGTPGGGQTGAGAPTGPNLVFAATLDRTALAPTAGTATAAADGRLTSVETGSSYARRGTASDNEHGGINGIIGWTRWAGGTVSSSDGDRAVSAQQGAHRADAPPISSPARPPRLARTDRSRQAASRASSPSTSRQPLSWRARSAGRRTSP
jgi:hypothetical protein